MSDSSVDGDAVFLHPASNAPISMRNRNLNVEALIKAVVFNCFADAKFIKRNRTTEEKSSIVRIHVCGVQDTCPATIM